MRCCVLVVAACGAQATPPASQPIAKREVVAIAPVTCGDVGVILRGAVLDEKSAGPMKEAAIARACLHDQWSTDVIECVGGDAKPTKCLEKLSKEQRAAFAARVLRWNDSFPDERIDTAMEDEPDHEDFLDCALVVGDVSKYAPALQQKGKERELALTLRHREVLALCDDWSTVARKCFDKGDTVEKCRKLLDPDQEQALADKIAEIDALMKRIEDVEKTPAALGCDKVVKAHYADAHWKGKLDGLKAGDRKKVIAESRTRMQKACADESWEAAVRGCIVANGGEACFGPSMMKWGFPASGIPIKTGIAECDAYGDTLRALATCTSIPPQATQTMLDNYQRAAPGFANMTGSARTSAATSCKASDAAIRQSAKSLGCTI